jgi:hypothetical protein
MGHRDHSSCLLPLSTIYIQACLKIDINKPCRLRLWNEAALALLACAPDAFFAPERVPKRAKKPPDRQESKPQKLIQLTDQIEISISTSTSTGRNATLNKVK